MSLIGSEDLSINSLQQLQGFVYLCEQLLRRQGRHGRIQGKLVISMRKAVLNIIREVKAPGKLK